MNTRMIPLVVLAQFAASAMAIELVGGRISVTPADAQSLKVCDEQGGCHVVTVAALIQMMEAAAATATKAEKLNCGRVI